MRLIKRRDAMTKILCRGCGKEKLWFGNPCRNCKKANTHKSQIMICPYCEKKLDEDRNFCCGEAGHGEWIDDDGRFD